MSPDRRTRFIYSPKYVADAGDHVFPTRKFALTAERLLRDGIARAEDFVAPAAPGREDLLLAHAPGWVDRALTGKLTLDEETRLELPWSAALAKAHALAVSGTILTCRLALTEGVGLHIGGGAHHAFPDHGEGFCAFNDIACGILKMRAEGRIRRAAVVDLDVHQGNGTNAIFAGDKDVLTFSMPQGDLYPEIKTPGDVDIELRAGMRDEEYLNLLGRHLPKALDRRKPELVVYQAGVDCYEKDSLGGLRLSKEGLRRRDEFVFIACSERGVPVAVTLGGGYAESIEETVTLHTQTLTLASRIARHASQQGVTAI